jgi:D-glycero-D-manno-heptose 1,7-bisphosphate phosphatase
MKAAFFDRDGIINIDHGYTYKIEDFTFCDGIFELMHTFEENGYILFIVTNQSGIGRGYYTKENFETLTAWMLEKFSKKGIRIEKVYFCPHAPEENCTCRKPQIGMFEQALNEFEIDMQNSWMIGDKLSDVQAGKNAGILNTVFVNTLTCKDAKYNVKSLLDIIPLI